MMTKEELIKELEEKTLELNKCYDRIRTLEKLSMRFTNVLMKIEDIIPKEFK